MAGVDPITSIAGAVDDAEKIALQKDAEKNTPEQIAAKQAQEVQALKDAILAAVEKGDLDAIRTLCA